MSEYQFNFKPFAEMTDADYAEVGFRSGLEIHQQLLTGKSSSAAARPGATAAPTTPRSSATCGRRSPSSASTTARR